MLRGQPPHRGQSTTFAQFVSLPRGDTLEQQKRPSTEKLSLNDVASPYGIAPSFYDRDGLFGTTGLTVLQVR